MALHLLRFAALLYLVASVATMAHIVKPRADGDRRVMVVVFAALIAHAVAVGGRMVEVRAFPLAGVHDALSMFGFISAVIAVIVAVRGGVPQVAWFSTPLVSLLVSIAAISEPAKEAPEALRSLFLSLHITLALLGDSMFVIAGVVAVVYLMHERQLKRRKKPKKRRAVRKDTPPVKEPSGPWSAGTALNSLPALEALDKVSLALFKIGFPLMTLGIITGVIYGKQHLDRYWSWDARNTVTAVVWIMYAAMLHARLVIGWRGRKAALLTVVGVIAILLTFVGLGIHGTAVHGGDNVT